jgi:hypothetical protein
MKRLGVKKLLGGRDAVHVSQMAPFLRVKFDRAANQAPSPVLPNLKAPAPAPASQ